MAKHFHDLGMRVNLFNDRSFSSVSSAGTRILAEGRVRESMVELLETSTYSSVVIADWAINAADAYNAIPANCKGYMYVDAKCEDNKGDGVIPHKASLHKALEGVRGQSGNRYRMFAPTDLLSSGHNARRVELISPDLIQTGEEIFDQFVKRVTG